MRPRELSTPTWTRVSALPGSKLGGAVNKNQSLLALCRLVCERLQVATVALALGILTLNF